MDVETVTLLFAMLALVTNALVVLFTIVAVGARFSGGAAGIRDALWDRLAPSALPLAALIGLTAMLGSLYYSEIKHYVPCSLCWYQRIAMYPLPIVLAIAAWKGDDRIRRYVIPLALVGSVISIYHYQLEWFPSQTSVACSATGAPCNAPYFREFGFISLAYMALSGFLAIAWLAWIAGQRERSEAT
jgi:disulfide bond formation protein DsbB